MSIDAARTETWRKARVTAYVIARGFRNQAVCGCGWRGKTRLLRGHSAADVFLHCNEFGHLPRSTIALWKEPAPSGAQTH
jgi:hypothetical protein